MTRADSSRNDGIIMNGGNITAEQIAVGNHASTRKAVYHGAGEANRQAWDEVRNRLAALTSALERHAAELPRQKELVAHTHEVTSELAGPSPDRGRIASLFDALLAGSKQIGEIASSVLSLKTLVLSLLGLG